MNTFLFRADEVALRDVEHALLLGKLGGLIWKYCTSANV